MEAPIAIQQTLQIVFVKIKVTADMIGNTHVAKAISIPWSLNGAVTANLTLQQQNTDLGLKLLALIYAVDDPENADSKTRT